MRGERRRLGEDEMWVFPVSRLRGSREIKGSKYVSTYLNSLTRKDGHIGNNTSMENDPVTVGSRLHDEPPDKSCLGG